MVLAADILETLNMPWIDARAARYFLVIICNYNEVNY